MQHIDARRELPPPFAEGKGRVGEGCGCLGLSLMK